jgi:hypothetical protein
MRAPPEPPSNSPPAATIGAKVHIDIVPIPTSIGGNNHLLFSVDDKSDFVVAVPMTKKSTNQLLKAMDTIIGTYLLHGHSLELFVSDDERNFNSTIVSLQVRKVKLSTTPAGLHQKKAERTIQTIKLRLAAVKASLSYCLPDMLVAEAYLSVIRQYNSMPTKTTGNMTPFQAFTRTKPQVPTYSFGTIGMFYHPRNDDKSLRGEIGIFISHGYHQRFIKGFLPLRNQMYSIRKFTKLQHQFSPASWNYKQNLRGTHDVNKGADLQPSGPKPTATSSMEIPSTSPTILDTSDQPHYDGSPIQRTPQSRETNSQLDQSHQLHFPCLLSPPTKSYHLGTIIRRVRPNMPPEPIRRVILSLYTPVNNTLNI